MELFSFMRDDSWHTAEFSCLTVFTFSFQVSSFLSSVFLVGPPITTGLAFSVKLAAFPGVSFLSFSVPKVLKKTLVLRGENPKILILQNFKDFFYFSEAFYICYYQRFMSDFL